MGGREAIVQIDQRDEGGIQVISLRGDLDAVGAEPVRKHLETATSIRQARIVLDLGGVEFLSSAGLWVLQGAVRAARAGGGDVRMAHLQPAARGVVEQTGFAGLFRMFATVQEATADFGMKVSSSDVGSVTVVSLDGDLDASTAGDVEWHARTLLDAGRTRLVLDFTSVPYIASAGLRVVQVIALAARGKGGDVRLSGLCPAVLDVFNMSGFTAAFKVFPTVSEATASYD